MPPTEILVEAILTYMDNLPMSGGSPWHIGITQHPKRYRDYLGNPPAWAIWEAESLSDARAIVSYFESTMKIDAEILGPLREGARIYVYVF